MKKHTRTKKANAVPPTQAAETVQAAPQPNGHADPRSKYDWNAFLYGAKRASPSAEEAAYEAGGAPRAKVTPDTKSSDTSPRTYTEAEMQRMYRHGYLMGQYSGARTGIRYGASVTRRNAQEHIDKLNTRLTRAGRKVATMRHAIVAQVQTSALVSAALTGTALVLEDSE